MAQAEKSKLSPALNPALRACGIAATLPRRVHSAVVRLLRPAESAARRLVIVVALAAMRQAQKEGVVEPFRLRKAKPKPASMEPIMRSLGIAVVLSPAEFAAGAI